MASGALEYCGRSGMLLAANVLPRTESSGFGRLLRGAASVCGPHAGRSHAAAWPEAGASPSASSNHRPGQSRSSATLLGGTTSASESPAGAVWTLALKSTETPATARTQAGDPDTAAKLDALAATGEDAAWEGLEARILDVHRSMPAAELVKILHGFTFARRRPKRLLSALAEELPERLPQLDAASLCICLHAYAQLRRKEPRLFTAVVRRLLQKPQRVTLEASHLASLLYSHARVLLSDNGLVRVARSRLLKEPTTFSAGDLATSLMALSTFETGDPVLIAQCVLSLRDKLQGAEASLEDLSDALHSLVKLGGNCQELQRLIAERCLADRPGMQELPAATLVKLLHALGEELQTATLRRELALLLVERLDELDSPKLLTQTMEAFSRGGGPHLHSDGQSAAALEALLHRMTLHMVGFSLKDVAATALACERLGVTDKGLLEALVRQAMRKGEATLQYRPQQGEAVLAACAAADFRHGVVEDLQEAVDTARRKQQERHAAREGKKRKPREDKAEADDPLGAAPLFDDGQLDKQESKMGPDFWKEHDMSMEDEEYQHVKAKVHQPPAEQAKPLSKSGVAGAEPELPKGLFEDKPPKVTDDVLRKRLAASRWLRKAGLKASIGRTPVPEEAAPEEDSEASEKVVVGRKSGRKSAPPRVRTGRY
eukprot:TRINITY_DN65328_c0_g1_i1.p1 TRINITY_DN65328_c0_g1~~TRINITY_DN65328_c0_g1_i1.p1  ORF type:complete len:661 (+),score=161.88 TRINITY_DN65328_c0_g1_i1:119-2101(+)